MRIMRISHYFTIVAERGGSNYDQGRLPVPVISRNVKRIVR
jgi:hypothetical protein